MIYIPVLASELVDRISLLEIAKENAQDKEQRRQLTKKLDPLLIIFQDEFIWADAVKQSLVDLRDVNRKLEDINCAIAIYLDQGESGETFQHLVSSTFTFEKQKEKILKEIDRIHSA